MNNAKYIVFNERKVVVFPALMEHVEMAKRFSEWKPTSAGFVSFGVNEEGDVQLSGYGESISLKLKAAPDDTRLLTRLTRDAFEL
jgi:hypothetical protein